MTAEARDIFYEFRTTFPVEEDIGTSRSEANSIKSTFRGTLSHEKTPEKSVVSRLGASFLQLTKILSSFLPIVAKSLMLLPAKIQVALIFCLILPLCLACPTDCTCGYQTISCSQANTTEVTDYLVSHYFKKVDLEFMNIGDTVIPQFGVEVLNFNNCIMAKIDQNFLRNVVLTKSMSFTRCFLTVLPNVSHFQYLESLSAVANDIKEIDRNAFEGNERLKSLDLSDNLLSDVSFLTPIRKTVQKLMLGSNFIRSFNIGDYPSLEFLCLAHNYIRSSNSIRIADAPKLTKVNLSRNRFVYVNARMFRNTSITELFMNECMLTSCGQVFEMLPTLQSLHLESNRFTSFHHVPKTLTHLSLHDNSLRQFPTFEKGSQMRYLKLSSNKISVVPYSELQCMSKLEYIDIIDNEVHSLDTFLVDHYLVIRVDPNVVINGSVAKNLPSLPAVPSTVNSTIPIGNITPSNSQSSNIDNDVTAAVNLNGTVNNQQLSGNTMHVLLVQYNGVNIIG